MTINEIEFIDDIYSFNDIYLAWTVSSNTNEPLPQAIEYSDIGNDNWKSIPVKNVTKYYQNNSKNRFNQIVYSITLNNLTPDTTYKIRYNPIYRYNPSYTIYHVRTLSKTDNWKLYLRQALPYAIASVGVVTLAPVALQLLGFGSGSMHQIPSTKSDINEDVIT